MVNRIHRFPIKGILTVFIDSQLKVLLSVFIDYQLNTLLIVFIDSQLKVLLTVFIDSQLQYYKSSLYVHSNGAARLFTVPVLS